MYYVYILKLNNGNLYTGSTPNLKRRLAEHEAGYALATKNFRPLILIWYCAFPDRLIARQFEAYLKTGSGKAFLRNRLIVM